MSRARLAVWAAGGALLAAWLSSAAGTTPGAPPSLPPAPAAAPPAASPPPARIDLDREVARMAAWLERAPRPRPAVRNPFAFGLAPRRPAIGRGAEPIVPAGWAPNPAAGAVEAASAPRVSLAGVATDETAAGPRRTAILSVDGQVVLARVGDETPGRYRVQRIDDDAVEIFDPGRQAAFWLRLP